MSSIPFGPERKDPPWRWGSFLVGIDGFVVLLAVATLGGIVLIGWWFFVFLILGVLFSLRSGRAWARGRPPEATFAKTTQPTVAVEGKAGATYVLLEPARPPRGSRVRPHEFSPFWWAVHSVFVRAPVAFGDFILTSFWRFAGGFFWTDAAAAERRAAVDPFDEHHAPPSTERRF